MQEEVKKTVEVLQNGGTILYPTDTIWGIGCDACNSKAIDKIYKIKFRKPEKSLILLASGPDMIKNYVEVIPDVALELMERLKDPLTIIYEKTKGLPKNLVPDDGTIAIRVPRDEFCMQVLERLGRPITSTSANISGDPSPVSFNKISDLIKQSVDYICTGDEFGIRTPKPSTIIKIFDDGQLKIIRN